MTIFAPYGASTTIEVTQTSQAVVLPAMPAGTPAFSLVSRQSSIGALYIRLGDGSVTVTEDTGMRVFPGTPESPTIYGVPAGETYIAILCVGTPGKVMLTAGTLLTGDTTTIISDDTVTNARLANMAAYTLKGRNAGTTGDPSDIDISALTEKSALADADLFLIQDSAASNAFKKVQKVNVAPAAALTRVNDTNVTLTLGGAPATAVLQATSITAGWSGTLAAARGGFGADISAQSGVPLFSTGVATFTASTGTGNFARATSPTLVTPAIGAATGASLVLTGTSANIIAAGRQGTTDPVLKIDASIASVVTGVAITGAASGGRAALAAISTATNEGLSIDAKGTGTIRLGAASTGAIEFSRNAVPTSSDGAALGTTSLPWSDLNLASGAVIDFNNGDVTIRHSSSQVTVDGGVVAVNLNSSALPTLPSDTMMAFGQADSTFLRFVGYSFSQGVGLQARRAGGTNASKAAVTTGEAIFSHSAIGYHSGGDYSSTSRASFQAVVGESWTSTNQGCYMIWTATPNGSASASEQFRVAGGAIYFPGAGTTASAANAYLDSGSSPANQLLRSTSSLRYKRDVEPVERSKADAVLRLNPIWYRSSIPGDRQEWSWYGLAAEEVAAVDPRLVHWGYRDEDLEEIELGEGEDDKHIGRRLREGAEKVPDGVMYERLSVLLIDVVKRQEKRIVALESRISELEVRL